MENKLQTGKCKLDRSHRIGFTKAPKQYINIRTLLVYIKQISIIQFAKHRTNDESL